MNKEIFLFEGPAGTLEVLVEEPNNSPAKALVFIAHPHPLYGGTMDNKVTQTIASTFLRQGCIAVRMNFRGVGKSSGQFDHGQGETEDWLALINHFTGRYPHLPVYYGGFSFGAHVMSQVNLIKKAEKMVLVGTPCGNFPVAEVPAETLLIHGELDETIPLIQVLQWAREFSLSVVVVAGADHFFHHRLTVIRDWITRYFFK
ncbi:MAG: alpha/beta hydrolase [Betaproteobacteria bacterium]|nr:alpha/beta hydrolase [Betaproteobacteria bacterium]MDE2423069.1 alpha/beta hydrolase [Betaproteobacteria bacterium]